MDDHNTDDERSTDTAERIARERLAADLDPREFGEADDLVDMLARVAAALQDDDLTVAQLDAACTHLDLVRQSLRDVSELHGWGWEEHDDATVRGQPEPDTEPEGSTE